MSLNILFVDDEQEILNGYKRLFFSMKKEWNQYFCLSGSEAIETMSKEKIDVIVSDLRMPQMGGVELLAKTKKHHPEIIRLVLSGHQDEIQAIHSTGVAHQFLSKPCDSDILINTIEHAMYLRNYVQNEKIRNIINGIGELPMLPDLYLKIEEELSKSEVSMNKVINLISKDIALVAKMMQLVNSSFFGFNYTVTNLEQALNFLGINIIKAIIVHYYMFSKAKASQSYNRFSEAIGDHSIRVGIKAKKIASYETNDKLIINFAFMGAILHDIGKIVLYNIPEYELKVRNLMQNNKIKYHEAEYNLFGFSHAEAGGYLLGIWGLSDRIVESVAFHHTPSKLGDNQFSAVTAVHIANILENAHREKPIDLDMDNLKYFLPDLDLEYLAGIRTTHKITDWLNY